MARVTVVMAAYQSVAHIGASVASVLSQTFRDFELVVVDDGSTDETARIVDACPGPLRLKRMPQNSGVSAARNAGIADSDGELVTFVDSDDYVFPNHLASLVEMWDRYQGIVTSNAWYLFPNGIDPRRMRYRDPLPRPDRQRMAILEQSFVSPLSVLNRNLGDRIGWFDESMRRAEDWDLWIRAIFEGARVSLVSHPSALYRVGSRSLSASVAEQDAALRDVLRKVATRNDLSEEERTYVERRLVAEAPHAFVRRGEKALRAGRYLEAARMYRAGAALVPSERRLVWKARLLTFALPFAAPLLRARLRRIEDALEIDERHLR